MRLGIRGNDADEQNNGEAGGGKYLAEYYVCDEISAKSVFLGMNVMSTQSKCDRLIQTTEAIKNITCLALQEIWKGGVRIPGFQPPIEFTRPKQRGGGCAIYLANGVEYVSIPVPSVENFCEAVAVKIKCK